VFELRMTFSEQRMNEIRECLISVGLKCGEKDAVKPYLERIVWNDENNKPFGVMVSLAEAYGETGDGELFFHYAEQILKNPQMKNPFFVTLEGILREHPERKAEISAWMLQKSAEEKQQKADTELQKLVAQLKANIQLLLAAGKTEEAKELLEALKELVPEK